MYDFLVEGSRPIVLLSSAGSGFSQEQVLGNHRFEQGDFIAGRATIELTRERVLNGHLEETLRVSNYNPFPVSLRVSYLLRRRLRRHLRGARPQRRSQARSRRR